MPERLGAAHWLSRAEEARLMAEYLGDTESHGLMLRIADYYDEVAQRAIERAAAKFIRPPSASSH